MGQVEKPEDYVRMVDEGLLKTQGKIGTEMRYGVKVRSILRMANEQDCEQLAALHKAALPGYPYPGLHSAEYHKKTLADPYSVRVVAAVEGEIVGASCLGINPYCLLGELKQLVVHPNHRRKGLANALVRFRLEIAEAIGLECVETHARTRDPGVQKALLNNGFECVGIVKGIYPVHHEGGTIRENMVYMVKYLNAGKRKIDEEDRILPEISKVLVK